MTESTTPPISESLAPPLLTPIEARVLATLMEKARTVPDTYPMTLNGLVTGCNQKTSRDPVMGISDAQALAALDELRAKSLVSEAGGGRTIRYAHHFQRGVGVPEQSAVLLGLLMLRGPQTAGELRLNAERWYRFADISSVEAFLDELQSRSPEKGGALVQRLPRAPGSREARWAHLLSGPVDLVASSAASSAANSGQTPLGSRVDELEAQVRALQALVNQLCEALGVSPSASAQQHATDSLSSSQET